MQPVPTPAAGAGGGSRGAAQGQRSKRKDKKKKKGARGPAQEVQVKDVNLVRIKCESMHKEPGDERHIVQLSKVHKATRMVLSDQRTSVEGRLGFRSARCSHGVHEGAWYCEATVVHLGATGHARLGWGTKRAEINAPMGFDEYGFCYRDLEGSKVFNGVREPYGEPYGEGDVIGIWIYLPPGGKPLEQKAAIYTKWKGKWMRIEDAEDPAEKLPGSMAGFCKNGVFQGVAFRDFLEGTYYPTVSLYTMPEQEEGAKATFNFGPDFAFPPPTVDGCPTARPMCEMAEAPPVPKRTAGEAAAAAALAAGSGAAVPGAAAVAAPAGGAGPASTAMGPPGAVAAAALGGAAAGIVPSVVPSQAGAPAADVEAQHAAAPASNGSQPVGSTATGEGLGPAPMES